MEVRSNNDGTYTIQWTPCAAGYYTINVTVDGQPLDEAYMVKDTFEPFTVYYSFYICVSALQG